MIEVRTKENQHSNHHYLFLDGVAVSSKEGSVIPLSSDPKQLNDFTANLYTELAPKAATSRFSDISRQIRTLQLIFHTHICEELYLGSVKAVRVNAERFDLFLTCRIKSGGWKYAWSIEEYIAEFSRKVAENSSSGVQWPEQEPSNIYMNSFQLSSPLAGEATLTIEAAIQDFVDHIKQLHELTKASLSLKSKTSEVEQIIRSIEFPPEYYHSGITVLSYFTDVLRHKNLAEQVKVSIEQSGLNVRLIIESPTGQRELIERTLETYALVVTGKSPIDTLTTDPYEAMELRSQLRIAHTQLQNQRDMLELRSSEVAQLRSDIEENRTSLRRLEQKSEADTARFMKLIETLASHNADLSSGFKELTEQAAKFQNKALANALENLYKMIERGVCEEDRDEVMQNLSTIQREDPSFFKRVYEVLIEGAITGAAGNYLYAWLQFFVGSLPK